MDNNLLVEVLYLFLISLIFAVFEIQIEGKNGWASALPTWRPSPSGYFSKIYRLILFGKDVTLYHLLIFTLLLAILHYPYFAGKIWSLNQELISLSFFFLLSVVWDFLWFVINPSYGFSRFKPSYIWWHKKWLFFLPVDYWVGLIFSALFYIRFSLNWLLFKEWLFILGIFFVFTLAIVILTVFIKKIRVKPNGKILS